MVDDRNDKTLAKQAAAQPVRTMWICPQCGKTVDMSRRYCNCHTDVRQATTTNSANRPEVGPCNFETKGLNCSDCPEDCLYCASFGEPAINSDGYGGKECRHRFGSAKCNCCQAQIDLAINLRDNVNVSQLTMEILARRRAAGKPEDAGGKNIWLEAADVIRAQMEEPVLKRINQYRERAGSPELLGRDIEDLQREGL
jgi:hypothetical protein